MTRWVVVGAGPCGIGAVARLLDFGFEVLWVDPVFQVGRMGNYYRNVPSNTLNGDLIVGFECSKSLNFVDVENKRRSNGAVCMSDLEQDKCYDLGIFVSTVDDCAKVLQKRVTCMYGQVTYLTALGSFNKWKVHVRDNEGRDFCESADIVLLCCGAKPKVFGTSPPQSSSELYYILDGVKMHNLDYMVDPLYCKTLLQQELRNLNDVTWAVIGNSHSAMLVLMNLIQAGATQIVNLYRSEPRFMHTTDEGWLK
jgi:pyruvate/2-oxoglutarate dehydrogenase complex dihydrolipoamide dehydrogenase (E3) component